MRRVAQILILAFTALLIVPVFLPNKIEVNTEREFHLPAGILFEEFNNMNNFSKWEPWAAADSLATQEFYSPYAGKGAGYQSQTKGKNRILTITESLKNKKIRYNMENFDLGSEAEMLVEFLPSDSVNTIINWKIETKKIGYFSRYYTYFTSNNLRETLNKGFDRLEKLLETTALNEEQAKSLQPGMIETELFEGKKIISVVNETTLDEDEVKTAVEESLGLIYSYLTDYLKLPQEQIGQPITYFDFINTATENAKFHSGYPIIESVQLGEGMELLPLPAVKAVVSIHKGNYSSIQQTISKMNSYAKENQLSLQNSYWEEYLNQPVRVKDSDELLIKIYIPIKE
ncbi:MAG: GyrI-like domain-containing protein [Weeksellaceae bacterium]|jgi:effector-binding domain-containing protein|nr:GyrI-like domain-containing protein [Weeksellaceae bacterium]